MFVYYKFIVVLVIMFGFLTSNSYAQKVVNVKTQQIDVNDDEIKDNIKFTIKLINHTHCAFLEIIDGKTKQNLFPNTLNPNGNIPIYPGDYFILKNMICIPSGKLNSNHDTVEILIYDFDSEINQYIDNKLVKIKVSGKNRDWFYAYDKALEMPGKNRKAIAMVRKFAYYCKTGQIEKAQKLTTVKLDNTTMIHELFKNEYYIHEIQFKEKSEIIEGVIIKFPGTKFEGQLCISPDQKMIIGVDISEIGR